MPYYPFENPETGEIRDFRFGMNDEKIVEIDGIKWNRVFVSPNITFDLFVDPSNPKAFMRKTEKGGTMGDLMDLSKEMSEKRGGDKNDHMKVEYTKKRKADLKARRKANMEAAAIHNKKPQ